MEDEKNIIIEPLPETKEKKKRGRKPLSPSKKKNKPKTGEKHEMTEARRKHYKKMQVMRSEKAKQRKLQKGNRGEGLNEVEKLPNLGYVVNPIENPTTEQSLIDMNIPPTPDVMLDRYSDLVKQQEIFSGHLQQFSEKFNMLDNYLTRIGVSNGAGSGNSEHILNQGAPRILQQGGLLTPHRGIANTGNPIVMNQSFRQRALQQKN